MCDGLISGDWRREDPKWRSRRLGQRTYLEKNGIVASQTQWLRLVCIELQWSISCLIITPFTVPRNMYLLRQTASTQWHLLVPKYRSCRYTRWRPVLYFPGTEFCTFFSGHVPRSSDLHVVWTFADMSGKYGTGPNLYTAHTASLLFTCMPPGRAFIWSLDLVRCCLSGNSINSQVEDPHKNTVLAPS